jgi:hypothetical protein
MPKRHGRRAAMYVQLNQSLLKQLRLYCESEGMLLSRVVESAISAHLAARAEGGAGVLSDETRLKLRALQQALWGASAQRLLEAAIDRFVAEQLAENPRLRERYDAAERALAHEMPRELYQAIPRFLTSSDVEEVPKQRD